MRDRAYRSLIVLWLFFFGYACFGAGTGGTKSVAAVGRDLLVGLHA